MFVIYFQFVTDIVTYTPVIPFDSELEHEPIVRFYEPYTMPYAPINHEPIVRFYRPFQTCPEPDQASSEEPDQGSLEACSVIKWVNFFMYRTKFHITTPTFFTTAYHKHAIMLLDSCSELRPLSNQELPAIRVLLNQSSGVYHRPKQYWSQKNWLT